MKNLGLLLTAGLSAGILMMSPAEAHQHESHSERTEAPADAVAYIISPQNSEKVPSKFKVKFGLTGMGVAPAGVDAQHTGHHHLMVDKKNCQRWTSLWAAMLFTLARAKLKLNWN